MSEVSAAVDALDNFGMHMKFRFESCFRFEYFRVQWSHTTEPDTRDNLEIAHGLHTRKVSLGIKSVLTDSDAPCSGSRSTQRETMGPGPRIRG